MRRLTRLSVFLVLTMLTENTRGHKKCLDDNTVYHGYNLVNARLQRNKKNTSMECQKACQHHPRCKYWSWLKKCGRGNPKTPTGRTRKPEPDWWCEVGHCHLFSIKGKERKNSYYVSGSKYCRHVSKIFVNLTIFI